jgi:hypothetical protein
MVQEEELEDIRRNRIVLFNDLSTVRIMQHQWPMSETRVDLCSIGGMMLTGENKVIREKPVPVPLCPP